DYLGLCPRNKAVRIFSIQAIEQVLASHALALELLPTASGFFFGSTDYDGYYFEVLRDTRHFLQKEFTYNSDLENLYYTEWW
ncbi:MAG: hypothetical protein ACTH1S_07125, partial [Leuconostoc falkenbergense]